VAQIDANDPALFQQVRAYFKTVKYILVTKHELSEETAASLVDIYFSLEVDPLERVLVMHNDPSLVARDLAQMAA
jgi:hypothetical protein